MYVCTYVNKYIVLCLQYYAESHAVIYIVDSSDRDRIPDSKETFGKIYISWNDIFDSKQCNIKHISLF